MDKDDLTSNLLDDEPVAKKSSVLNRMIEGFFSKFKSNVPDIKQPINPPRSRTRSWDEDRPSVPNGPSTVEDFTEIVKQHHLRMDADDVRVNKARIKRIQDRIRKSKDVDLSMLDEAMEELETKTNRIGSRIDNINKKIEKAKKKRVLTEGKVRGRKRAEYQRTRPKPPPPPPRPRSQKSNDITIQIGDIYTPSKPLTTSPPKEDSTSDNTFIGQDATLNISDGSNNVAIGYSAGSTDRMIIVNGEAQTITGNLSFVNGRLYMTDENGEQVEVANHGSGPSPAAPAPDGPILDGKKTRWKILPNGTRVALLADEDDKTGSGGPG